jgi:hypothetical protein
MNDHFEFYILIVVIASSLGIIIGNVLGMLWIIKKSK